jgi:mannose-1-phosphate guanylyltransferase/mannose-1-phosphate guanylyltransferase/mannose-6-phosphate isomerase
MAETIHPVILCGGSGTRLWPLSRQSRPKQFLPLVTSRSLLQDTAARVASLPECAAPILMSNHEHRFMIAEQLQELGITPAAQILEPVARNTAPAIAVAALQLRDSNPDSVMLVLPSDHAIADTGAFHAAVRTAARSAAKGLLVTFGIRPSEPNTGFGYIERGEPVAGEAHVFRVGRFVEKPDLETARSYIASGRFSWNSGMFLFSPRRFLEELERFRPDILKASARALQGAVRDMDFIRLERAAFEAAPAESIDYAVMERTSAGAVVEADFGWSDVGSWSSLWEAGEKDASGNMLRGDVQVKDTSGSYLRSDKRLLFALGVKDLVVVDTDDALFVGARSRAQEVKDFVQWLDKGKRPEHVSHKRVYRPWGYFESIDAGERFQVKRIMVRPRQALSLQLHHKRAEHWVVVSGTARVTRGDSVFELAENESTYIPVGTKHRLENPTDQPLYLIEVQSGAYLGEDDIVRFEDRYDRK